MATDPKPAIQVGFTPEFKRNLRQLAKKYRKIKADIQPILDQLASGSTPGDRIPGVQFEVYKARAKNSDSQKGKSGGYRVIYQVNPPSNIVLVTLYSKTDQADVTPEDIRDIILRFEAEARAQQELNQQSDPGALRGDGAVLPEDAKNTGDQNKGLQ